MDEGSNASLQFLLRAWVWPAQEDFLAFLGIGLNIALIGYCLSQAYRLGDALVDWLPFIDWVQVADNRYSSPIALVCDYDPAQHHPDKCGTAGRVKCKPFEERRDSSDNVLVTFNKETLETMVKATGDLTVPPLGPDFVLKVKLYKCDTRDAKEQRLGDLFILPGFEPPLRQPTSWLSARHLHNTMCDNRPGFVRHSEMLANINLLGEKRLFWDPETLLLRNALRETVGNYGTCIAPTPACLLSGGGGSADVPMSMWHALMLTDPDVDEDVLMFGISPPPPQATHRSPALPLKLKKKKRKDNKGKKAAGAKRLKVNP